MAEGKQDTTSAEYHEGEAARLNDEANGLDHTETVEWVAITPNLRQQDLRQRSIFHATMAVAARLRKVV